MRTYGFTVEQTWSGGRMITGFNHNIKYKDRIYHVQTEDSGHKNPHIITHLFVGGNIIASKKSEYKHLLDSTAPDKLEAAVRTMMEEQHKQMLRNLIHGKFDGALNAQNAHHLNGPAPLNVDPEVLAKTGGSGNRGPAAPPAAPKGAPAPWPEPAPAPPAEVQAALELKEKPVERPTSDTIFGEDLISEKSLDEVILSYLSKDG